MAVRYFQQMGMKSQEELIKRYTTLGEDAMWHAFHFSFRETKMEGETGVWSHISHNLADSFGSAVYVDGVLRRETVRYINRSPQSTRRDKYSNERGREAIDNYFNKIHPFAGTGDICVVVAAAMYYTKFLEEGSYGYNGAAGLRPKIRVVSAARDYIDRNWWYYMRDIYVRWQLPKPKARIVRGDMSGIYNYYNA